MNQSLLHAIDALLVGKPRAAALIDVSVYEIDNLRKAGRLESVRIGRRVLIRVESLRKLIAEGAPKRTDKDFKLPAQVGA
jgi:hypothetical protein